MKYNVTFNINERLYIKDPESTEIGRQILKNAIHLIYNLGFEQFNFKKLAVEIDTTEATIYRYFENKHKLLLYIFNWYWNFLAFLLEFKLQNVEEEKKKIDLLIEVLTLAFDSDDTAQYNKRQISQIVINEHSKVYLTKNIDEINKEEVFKPYKNLCSSISEIIQKVSPNYNYPKSLSSTIIETAHYQNFFNDHLKKLTDVREENKNDYTYHFLKDMVYRILDLR